MVRNAELASSHAERLLAVVEDATSVRTDRPRVLLLDADPTVAEALRAHFSATRAEFLYAATAEEARARLAATEIALTIFDPAVAGDEAWRFASRLAEHAARTDMPVIAMRRGDDAVSDVELYLLGIDATIGPPVRQNELLALVRGQLRKAETRRIRKLRDPITGLPSPGAFRDAWERAAAMAGREREALSLVVIHASGLDAMRRATGPGPTDEVFATLAHETGQTLRQSDLLARGEGDTLLLLLPNTDFAGAERVLEKLHRRLERVGLLVDMARSDLRLEVGTAVAAPRTGLRDTLDAALGRLAPLRGPLERALAFDDTRSPVQRRRILLAEDDTLCAAIIRDRLERLGHEVIRVEDGASVLRMAPEADLSLLILDVKMPFVDGFELLRRLRGMRTMRRVPMMLVTSMGNEEDIARGFELGADDYLVKPFAPIELQARVQRLLR